MNQAIVDPEQLRRFASNLKIFTEELQQRSAALASQMNQLEQSWRDQQQRKFSQEFEDQMRQMNRLLEASRQHVPYLLRKAEQVEQYLHG
ncbi:WXG100 family type VII secretion target [Candidatus Laterigemmans baculatus]|uniref:WXG100 family type VII secretion target n=1 Tax=Candidatus Laterigemmans baculatus TaxID=2770505 RepID=UPI0013DA30D2|nr:WXG100 family type VII secretion target [Candidatus Laterigemmans baculatus]